MKKAIVTGVLLAALGAGGYAYYRQRNTQPAPSVMTSAVVRGDIADTVGATGTLQAVTTVQVGSQVSGTIQTLYADFNSLVRKGQVLARLDPSLFQTQIEQARANLIRAQADLDRLRVALDDARTKLTRAQELSERQLIPRTELESSEVAVRSAEAQIRSAEAQVTQAQASLNQNQVNLQHTVITAPIDGLVISRNVDAGQTVAASMNAPVLFILAADLSLMQVVANLDESDVGRIRPGQRVTFTVDAYPAEDFVGTVSQVRLQPQVIQNVVSYSTVIDVPNPGLKLKPGMTATVSVEIARRDNVLRVPNAALRFRPTNEIFAALGQQAPEMPFGNASVRTPDKTASPGDDYGAPAGSTAPPPGEGAVSTPSLQRRVSPGQRQRVREAVGEPAPLIEGASRATTIDALFGPLPAVETAGRVWVYENGAFRPVPVRLGITDGQATELLAGDLPEGTEVVTVVNTGAAGTRPTPTGPGGLIFMGGRGGSRGAPQGR
ncbi:MAG: efflux RND transporter periplasmic adaptor subunit [Vicinamibacterales bacterium]